MRDFQTQTRKPTRPPRPASRSGIFGGSADRGAGSPRPLPASAGALTFHIHPGSRKSVLIEVVMGLWREQMFAASRLFEARGREISDEAKMSRVCVRSTASSLLEALGETSKSDIWGGRKIRIVCSGQLTGTSRTTLEKLGFEVHEERDPDERRYLDMTPFVLASAGLLMAVRYLSLGLNDQVLYIFGGLGMAVLYCLRPFLYDMKRPRGE